MNPWAANLVFAFVLTGLLAAVGFNRPSWSRSYTTAARYGLAAVAHVAVYLLLLLVVGAVLQRLRVATDAAGTPEDVVWAALALTLCVRAAPPLARRIRARMHRLAGIPNHAWCLAKFLADSPIEASAEIQAQARTTLEGRGIDADRDWLPLARPLHRQMFTTTQLFIQLRAWEEAPAFSGFAQEAADDLFRLRQRFDRLSFQVSRTLAAIERLGEMKHIFSQCAASNPDLDDHLRHLVSDMISDLCEDISLFHREACVLAARGILSTQPTRRGRDAAVAGLGFVTVAREPRTVYSVFPHVAALLFMGLWVFFLILPPDDTSTLTLGQRIAIIMINVLGALVIAIAPKLHFGFASSGLRQHTPWVFVGAAGVCAMLFAMLVNLAAGALIYGGWTGALRRLAESARYLPSTFLTATTVAWLVQDHRWRLIGTQALRRLGDAGTFGLAWLVSSLIALLLSGDPIADLLDGSSLATLFGSFVFGAAMGGLIPEFARSKAFRAADGRYLAPLWQPERARPQGFTAGAMQRTPLA